MDTSAHVPQLDHLGFENLKKYLKEVSTYFSLNLTRSETLMLPKIPPGHSPEIVMLLVLLLNWKSMSKTSLGTFWGFRSPNGLREMCWGVCLGLAQKEISTRYLSSNLLRLISSTVLRSKLRQPLTQLVLDTSVWFTVPPITDSSFCSHLNACKEN